jgi:hypothetical protein
LLDSTRIRGMAGSVPTITSHRATSLKQANAGEILDSLLRLTPPTVAPGQTPGALRFVSLALHILRIRAKGAAGTFQRGKFPNRSCIRKHIFYSHTASLPRIPPQKTRSTQQAWMNSRNQTNITSAVKHRQPLIMHPTGHQFWSRVGTPFRVVVRFIRGGAC